MPECRVLLVDDEADFLDVLAKRLSRRGPEVTGVGSGEAAVEIMARQCFDVVILDMKMSGMDGLQTLRLLKRDHPDVEVVMLTGHANMEAAVTGMDLGAFDYMIKPVDIGELLEKVEDALRERRLKLAGKGISSGPQAGGAEGSD